TGESRHLWWKQPKAADKEEAQLTTATTTATTAAAAAPSRPRPVFGRPVPQLQPMLIKRLAPEDAESNAGGRLKRVATAANKNRNNANAKPSFSMDEYLEIKKYKGVEWEDLPDYLKIRRLLEWKGTEPPELAEQRELERRQRLLVEEAAAKYRRYQAQREARRAAREAKVAEDAVVVADAKAWNDLQSRKHGR
ncbi:hypothetical protein DFQ26_002275, partial [Actinomortierella ambigua]